MSLDRSSCLAALALAVNALPATAAAQNYDILIDNDRVVAEPVKQQVPEYPGRDVRSGQEGWVRLNFVIDSDGSAIDPIIVDSSGGVGFERSAIEAMSDWQFAPSDRPRANNSVDIRFEIYRGRDAATSNFMRRYRRVVMHVQRDDQGFHLPGWQRPWQAGCSCPRRNCRT